MKMRSNNRSYGFLLVLLWLNAKTIHISIKNKHIVGYLIDAGIFFNIFLFKKYTLFSAEIISYFIILNSISKNVKNSVKWHIFEIQCYFTYSIKKTRGGGRKWPFVRAGQITLSEGGTEILVFDLGGKNCIFLSEEGLKKRCPSGVTFSGKCLRGVKLSK